ncbi:MAG: DUF11 domain-containing protein [Lysobacter sp.]|nr:DUF11 domain-containing protein [Lysobacter sp.]
MIRSAAPTRAAGRRQSAGWFGVAAFVLLAVFAQAASAQNLIVNPGFENNPPPNFGNNFPYPITPWVLGPGNVANVVKVDGGATYNYGNRGPALDADPATGVGVRQHYLDIANGANDFYQTFTVPVCGGAPGSRQVTFSGWFSTRDNLSGNGAISVRDGAGLGGTVLGSVSAPLPAPVPPATSGNSPWVQVSGTATVTAGTTISFVVSMDNNVNFDDASLTFVAVTCVTSPLTLRKTWIGAVVNDTASVRVSRGATIIDTLASIANTPNETDTDATPATVFAGEQVKPAETLGVANVGAYAAALACTGDASLSGSTLTIGGSGGPITCTYTNRRLSADLGITKTNGTTTVTSGASTTYTVVVTNNGPDPVTGAVVSDTPNPAGLTCPPANPVTCAPAANCPVGALTIGSLSAGVMMPTLANGASATFTFVCSVQ